MAIFQNAVTGFNVNIPRRGKRYHVQTEDSGVNNPHIITHLFLGGNIIATTKSTYADIVGEPDLAAKVRSLMDDQHKAMIRDLLSGKFDEKASHSVQLHGPEVDMLTPYQEPIKRSSKAAAKDASGAKSAAPDTGAEGEAKNASDAPQAAPAAAAPARPATTTSTFPAVKVAAKADSVQEKASDAPAAVPGVPARQALRDAMAAYLTKSRASFGLAPTSPG